MNKYYKTMALLLLVLAVFAVFAIKSENATAYAENYEIGSYVTFGTYPQTAEGNDNTPIEWLVLDRDGDKAFLLSRYCLDLQQYNTDDNERNPWEYCDLRTWLNNDFINRAFTSEEQAAILLTDVKNNMYLDLWWDVSESGRNDTEDKVFLLSYAEVNEYLGVDWEWSESSESPKACAASTEYLFKRIDELCVEYLVELPAGYTFNTETEYFEVAGHWWLRSTGAFNDSAVEIEENGGVCLTEPKVYYSGVRPAMWVDVGVISGTTVIESTAIPNVTPTETPVESYNTNTSEFAVGSYVTFGTYPMTEDGDVMNIVWKVLDRDGDKALLLSRYGLDAQPYNSECTEITWENCTLRAWLNNDFLNRSFTAEEQFAILLTDIDNSNAQCYSKWTTSGGNNTQDMVFLLSYAEANEYLGVTYGYWNNKKAFVAPTAYAVAQGVMISDEPEEYYVTEDGLVACQWWLRSPGHSQDYAICVLNSGDPISGTYVSSGHICVRPAMWVDVKYLQ